MTDGSDIQKGYGSDAGDAADPATGSGSGGGLSRDRARVYAGVLIGALLTLFAVVNLDDVRVHWIVGTAHTPLIIVIVVAFLCGLACDRLILRVQRRRAKAD